jgi:hypothetical protein
MPWQTAPPLIIIGLAFNAAAGLMWGAQRLGYGEVSSCLIFFHWLCGGSVPLYWCDHHYRYLFSCHQRTWH